MRISQRHVNAFVKNETLKSRAITEKEDTLTSKYTATNQKRRRRHNAPEMVAKVIEGVKFEDGVEVKKRKAA